jgi:nucleotide-binding universal stress UspA family protein
MYANVLVGINGLAGDLDAVALAQALTPGHDQFALAHVRLIDAVPSRGSNSAFDVVTRDRSLELLEHQRSALAPDARVISVPAATVGEGMHSVAESRRADLIVLGSCHRSAAGRIFMGDDASAIIHRASCAVAVAPAGYAVEPQRIGTIAAAYDGSAESEVAVAHAALLAAAVGAEAHARSIVELRVYGVGGWAGGTGALEDPEIAISGARERLGELPGIELEVIAGPVREELAALSERVDMLVCGSRHHPGVKRVLLGSTSDYLARHSACPLLVTPATDVDTVASWHEQREAAVV